MIHDTYKWYYDMKNTPDLVSLVWEYVSRADEKILKMVVSTCDSISGSIDIFTCDITRLRLLGSFNKIIISS